MKGPRPDVFLRGNGLPARWQRRDRFTVLELGFGLGHNFLATWQAWRDDAQACRRLVFVSIERHPPRQADLARVFAASPAVPLAQALIEAWPPLTAGLHPLSFDGGRVELLLGFGDVRALLPALRLQADAVYLDGFAPGDEPEPDEAMWSTEVLKAVGRRAAAGATLATWSVAPALHQGLRTAGFAPRKEPGPGSGGQREITVAAFAPRFALPLAAPVPRSALVVGAGLAGAAAARALARRGVAVTVLEQQASAAAGASANPAALFHATVHADDGPYARLFRAAALFAAREYRAAGFAVDGLLRLADADAAEDAPPPDATSWPADFVRALGAAEASALAAAALPSPAWLFAAGGWVEPARWVHLALATPGITLRTGGRVARIENQATGWSAFDDHGACLGEADALVLANAEGAEALLAARGHRAWPLHRRRGQVTWWTAADEPHGLRLPVAGDGYAIPLPGGALLCGATRQADDNDPAVRDSDHADNLQRLRRLTGITPAAGAALQGWVGWRLHSDDRLPIAGALPLASMPAGQRLDQARLLPREPGLFVLTALGARGATLAPLLGELVAALATGDAGPLEQDLADALDPGRWLVRAARARQ